MNLLVSNDHLLVNGYLLQSSQPTRSERDPRRAKREIVREDIAISFHSAPVPGGRQSMEQGGLRSMIGGQTTSSAIGTAGATTSPVNQTRALAGDCERRRLKGPKDSLATDWWHLPAGAERTSFAEYWPIGATFWGAGVNRKAL
jgi:hypothetical protein